MTPEEAYRKAIMTGEISPELEDIILTSPRYANLYARNIIKKRWLKAENVIMTHPMHSYLYAFHITKGKLPEKMHNMMILHAIEEPNSYSIKQYFEFIR